MSQFSKIAEQFKFIDPYELRTELAKLFKEDGKFQLGKMDDPVEALFAFLNAFHSYSVNGQSLKYVIEKPCNPPCLAHNLFWINILEQFECDCGSTSEVLKYDYNYFFYEAYVKEILTHTQKLTDVKAYQNKFFNFLKNTNSETTNPCPEKCRINKVKRNLFLLNLAPYMCFNLVWRESNPKLTEICKLFFMLPLKFKNKDLFELADNKNAATYELFGLVCYWGAHYICFFKNEDSDGSYWVNYDDMIITKIPTWKDLIIKCIRSHFHPTILFYKKAENERNYSSLSELKNEANDQDWVKIMDYCVRFDKENDYPYKHEELESSRLRPSSNNKRKSDEDLTKIKLMRTSQIKPVDTNEDNYDDEELKFEKIKSQVEAEKETKKSIKEEDNKTIGSMINNKLSVEIDKRNSTKKDKELPNPGEDEWICENDYCQNINKIDTYICLKCKEVNQNIYDLILQKRYASRSKLQEVPERTMKREQSLPQKSMTFGDRSINRNNINSMNPENKFSPELYCVCDNCQHANFYWKLECQNCRGPIQQPKSITNKFKNDNTGKYNTSPYNNLSLGSNSQYNNNSSTTGVNVGEYSGKNLTQWTCKKCYFTNKNSRDYCEKCYVSRDKDQFSTLGTPKNQNSFLNSNKSGVNTRINSGIGNNKTTSFKSPLINPSQSNPNQSLSIRSSQVNPIKPADTSLLKRSQNYSGVNNVNTSTNKTNFNSTNNRSGMSTNVSYGSVNRSSSLANSSSNRFYRK